MIDMLSKIIVIVANGCLKNNSFNKNELKHADFIICADGGANKIRRLKIAPHYLIGDMDSVTQDTLRYLKKTTKIIVDTNQHNTDLDKAIMFATTFKPLEIRVLGAIGDNLDHTIANLISLHQVSAKIKISIIDEQHAVFLLHNNSIEILGKSGDIISVIPISPIRGLSYRGLKWSVRNQKVTTGWCGVRNQMTGKKARITLKKRSGAGY